MSKIGAPVISDGIRSAVNWMRPKWQPSTRPSVRTNSVLPRPGTLSTNTCPLENSATERTQHEFVLSHEDLADLTHHPIKHAPRRRVCESGRPTGCVAPTSRPVPASAATAGATPAADRLGPPRSSPGRRCPARHRARGRGRTVQTGARTRGGTGRVADRYAPAAAARAAALRAAERPVERSRQQRRV